MNYTTGRCIIVVIKIIPIKQIEINEESFFLRDNYNDDAVERYADMYSAGNHKPILVSQVGADKYKLVDGFHRIKACGKIKREKIEAEVERLSEDLAYERAIEENLKHGIILNKAERQKALKKLLLENGKTQTQVAKIFGVSDRTITNWVRLDESLVSELTSKTNDSIINENLKGLKQVEIAGSYGLNPSRVSQIWNEFLSKINKELNEGLMFSEIKENNKKIQFPEKWLETKFEESKIELGDCIEKLLP